MSGFPTRRFQWDNVDNVEPIAVLFHLVCFHVVSVVFLAGWRRETCLTPQSLESAKLTVLGGPGATRHKGWKCGVNDIMPWFLRSLGHRTGNAFISFRSKRVPATSASIEKIRQT